MSISTFSSGLNQSHWAPRLITSPGPAGSAILLEGDNSKLPGPDERRSTYHIWDLTDPDSGSPSVPKNAIVDEAYIEFIPQHNLDDVDDDNHERAIALMASDGHWDRSAQNALHQANGAAFYYGASQTDVLDFMVRNSADSEIADTMVDPTGGGWLSNTGVTYLQGLGTTVEIPAGEDIKTVRVPMRRLDAPLPGAPTLQVFAYELSSNGRQYALDSFIAASEPVAYGSLALQPAQSDIDFTFATAIPSQGSSRWIGLMIEGEIFDPTWFGTQIYQLWRRNVLQQNSYPLDTAGSWLNADPDTDIANANSIVGYLNSRSVPCIYQNNFTTPLMTPYQRYFGSVMTKRACGPWVWPEPKTYGSAAADEEFPDFVQNVQDWLDSDYYSPGLGKTWIGFMIDIPAPNNVVFRTYGPGDATYDGYKLIIEWHALPLPVPLDVGDLTRRTVITADNLTRRTIVTAGDLTRRMAVAAGDLTRRTTVAAGDLTRRTTVAAGNLKRGGS
jgi:hypothetical protein